MSIVLTVRRSSVAPPLTRSEIEQVLSSSQSFSGDEIGGWRLVGVPSANELFLNVDEDEAWTDGGREWCSEPALAELRALAGLLNARVFGEEGEDITEATPTDDDLPTEHVGKPAIVIAAILAVILAPFILLLAVLRLPWVLWRLVVLKGR